MDLPNIIALDFDGVICDGLIEYFQTTKLAYTQIWEKDFSESIDDVAPSFYRLRPVIETGWEMIVLLRALVLKVSEEKILEDWASVALQIIESESLNSKDLSERLDLVRDRAIESDLDGWLKLHRFYPGLVERMLEITKSETELYIVSTKEGRFIKTLLQQQGIELPESAIIGKECLRPKHQILRELGKADALNVWFVEDRLKTLQTVQQQPDLKKVKLFLAAWGYNTRQARESINGDRDIQLLSLEQFNREFSAWKL